MWLPYRQNWPVSVHPAGVFVTWWRGWSVRVRHLLPRVALLCEVKTEHLQTHKVESIRSIKSQTTTTKSLMLSRVRITKGLYSVTYFWALFWKLKRSNTLSCPAPSLPSAFSSKLWQNLITELTGCFHPFLAAMSPDDHWISVWSLLWTWQLHFCKTHAGAWINLQNKLDLKTDQAIKRWTENILYIYICSFYEQCKCLEWVHLLKAH